MQRKNLARSALLLTIAALVYFTYSYIAANGSGNLTLTADSVAFKHGCLKPDSSCFRVIYRFPVPAGHNSSRIEKLIITDYLGLVEEDSKAKNIDQLKQVLVKNAMSYDSSYVEFQKQFGSSIEWFINIDFSQVFHTKRLLTICYEQSSYLGGAHGMYGYHYLNIDLKKSKILQLTDLVSDMERFKSIAQKLFTEQYLSNPTDNTDYWMANDGSFVLPEEYGLTAKGILLHYNVYEIASFARGDIKLLIPYNDISDILIDWYREELKEI